MSKCGLYALLFVPLLAVSSLLSFDYAKAASPYDDLVDSVVTDLNITCGETTRDVSTLWSSFLNPDVTQVHEQNIRTTWNNPGEPGTEYRQGLWETYNDRVDDLSGYAVTTNEAQTEVNIYFATESGSELEFATIGSATTLRSKSGYVIQPVTITCREDLNNDWLVNYRPPQTDVGILGSWQQGDNNIWLINFPFEVPTGYDGIEIPDSRESGADFDNTPKVTYVVEDKQIDGTIIAPNGSGGVIGVTGSNYMIKIFDSDDEEVFSQTTEQHEIEGAIGGVFHHTFEDYGNYRMVVTHYTSPPMLPSTFDPLIIDPLVIDGSTYTAKSWWLDCDFETGICSGLVNPEISPVQQALKDAAIDMNGIEQVVFIPLAFLATLPDKVNNCTPLSVPFGGNNMNIPCTRASFVNAQPALAAVVMGFVNGLVALAVGYGLFTFIRETHSPDSDKVEVLKL